MKDEYLEPTVATNLTDKLQEPKVCIIQIVPLHIHVAAKLNECYVTCRLVYQLSCLQTHQVYLQQSLHLKQKHHPALTRQKLNSHKTYRKPHAVQVQAQHQVQISPGTQGEKLSLDAYNPKIVAFIDCLIMHLTQPQNLAFLRLLQTFKGRFFPKMFFQVKFKTTTLSEFSEKNMLKT